MFKPSKDTVLTNYALSLGRIPNETVLLMSLSDKRLFNPFTPGDEPTWMEVLRTLLLFNRHLDVFKVMRMIREPKPKGLYDR